MARCAPACLDQPLLALSTTHFLLDSGLLSCNEAHFCSTSRQGRMIFKSNYASGDQLVKRYFPSMKTAGRDPAARVDFRLDTSPHPHPPP
jgi:hypothetical protein